MSNRLFPLGRHWAIAALALLLFSTAFGAEPRPARAATRRLAAANVHPNTVTIASWVLALAVFWLFARGHFGIGLAAAWLMTFLDTVDGEVASAALAIVAAHGDEQDFARFLELRDEAATPQDQVRYLRAAAAVPGPFRC